MVFGFWFERHYLELGVDELLGWEYGFHTIPYGYLGSTGNMILKFVRRLRKLPTREKMLVGDRYDSADKSVFQWGMDID